MEVAAAAIGEDALRVADGRALTATAVFGRSFYLEDGSGEMLCALSAAHEPGPLHVNCAGWPESVGRFVTVGDAFVLEDGALRSKTFRINLAEAAVWRPPVLPPTATAASRSILNAIRGATERIAPRDTLLAACLFPEKADAARLPPVLLAETQTGVRALSADDPRATEILLGLGPGLTPSGDDILAGALFALRAFYFHDKADRLAERVLPLLHRTNRISAAHLRAAARGRCAAAFHDLLITAAAGDDPEPYLARIAAIGHTSGWDALLGILLAHAPTCGNIQTS